MSSDPLRNLASWLLFVVRTALMLGLFLLFGALLLVFLLIAIPVFLIRMKLTERRRVQKIAREACPSCGRAFGEPAARKARARMRMRFAESFGQLRSGNLRLPIAQPMLEIECPECGTVTHSHPGSGLRVLDQASRA